MNRQTRSCATVSNHFRILDNARSFRRNLQKLERADKYESERGFEPINVVVHILYRGRKLSEKRVFSQIEVLNQCFNAKNLDLKGVPKVFKKHIGNPKLTFRLAKVDPNGKKCSGINYIKTNINEFPIDKKHRMKYKKLGGVDAWDTARYLNIWVCELEEDTLGYAQFPGGPKKTDGVVINTSAFGVNNNKDGFNKGRTAVHEVGHYLNLSHIWGESVRNNCTDSDYVHDTPNQLEPNGYIPKFPSISCCNGPNGDMFMNYMDYVPDKGMLMFTKGQVARMHTALRNARPDLTKERKTRKSPTKKKRRTKKTPVRKRR